MGQPARGRGVASEALSITRSIKDRARTRNAYAYLGLADYAAGDTVSAERNFVRADRIEYADDPAGEHLYSLRGCWWAELLLRTGRHLVAWRLTQRNRSIGQLHAWNEDVACCERLLGGCELAEGRLGHAGRHFESAVAVFRRGSSLLDLAYALVDLAEQRRRDGRMDEAERACLEALDTAGPRELIPCQAAALASRARIRADRYAGNHTITDLEDARDDATHALRLATTICQLPWQELDAIEAHAHIDRSASTDGGWAERAIHCRAALIPADLDPDPLATIEAEAARGAELDAL